MSRTFVNEGAFEDHLRNIIDSRITSKFPNVYALKHKAIGDIVITRDGPSPAMFFLEVKYFRSSNNRIGIGHESGVGIQPEILERRPAYLETHLRWAFASASHGDDRYWLATSDVVSRYISGGGIGRKYNNIQKRLLDDRPSIDESQLVQELMRWLLT